MYSSAWPKCGRSLLVLFLLFMPVCTSLSFLIGNNLIDFPRSRDPRIHQILPPVLQSTLSASNLNVPRYFRLMALAATLVLFSLPITVYGIISDFRLVRSKPWVSWADTHQNLRQVRFISHEAHVAQPLAKFLFDLGRWISWVGRSCSFFSSGYRVRHVKNTSEYFRTAGHPAVCADP
jgi:hypothetical protein